MRVISLWSGRPHLNWYFTQALNVAVLQPFCSLWLAELAASAAFILDSFSHVNRVTGLVKLCVSREVRVHLAHGILILQAVHTRATLAVDDILVVALGLVVRVAEDFTIVGLFSTLRLAETVVEHVLVVLDESCVTAELVVKFVLCVRQNVTLISHRSCVRMAAIGLCDLVVLAQIGVKGARAVSRSVISTKSTRVVADVGIATTAIVYVNDGLRVDIGQVVGGALLQELESAYRHKVRGQQGPPRLC